MFRVHFNLIFIFLLYVTPFAAQIKTEPVAKFSFNNGKDYDEVSNTKIKEVGVKHADDRFDNKNSAIYFYGHEFSYVNLGTGKALKPKIGSISLWVNLFGKVWSGSGYFANPIIITKNSPGDDFYEGYGLCYYLNSNKIGAMCSRDSTHEMCICSLEDFKIAAWHHLVVTFDNTHLSFYNDGKLEQTLPKNFETTYLETDSVILGITANKKNNRFFSGKIDDIEIYDRVLSPDEIYDLYTAPNPNKNAIILNWVLLALAGLACIVGISLYIRYRIRIALKKEKQQLVLANKALENELRVHRALMNPHFIFNSLNGLQNFILTNATENANDYLVKFSKLIRKILESNMSDTITVELETELLERYLEIEEMRFEENITHAITVDPAINSSVAVIPIMMLQPFVENSIWHGLLNKEGEKFINITFTLYKEKYIRVVIEDNGIGRQNMSNDSKEKKSLATLFVKQRLELLNKIHNLNCSLNIEDKPDRQGTIINIILPILNG